MFKEISYPIAELLVSQTLTEAVDPNCETALREIDCDGLVDKFAFDDGKTEVDI